MNVNVLPELCPNVQRKCCRVFAADAEFFAADAMCKSRSLVACLLLVSVTLWECCTVDLYNIKNRKRNACSAPRIDTDSLYLFLVSVCNSSVV